MNIMSNPIFAGGAMLGILTGIIYSLKGFGVSILKKIKDKYIFRVSVYDYDEFFFVLEDWLSRNYQSKYRNLEASYEHTPKWVNGLNSNNDSKEKKITYKQESNLFIITYNNKRLVFSKMREKLEHATELKNALNYHYSISGWMAKQTIKSLLAEITKEYNEILRGDKVAIYVPAEFNGWNIMTKKKVKPFSNIILPSHTKNFLIEDLEKFDKQKEWYHSMNLIYKRSYILYGKPGTGKTTLAQAMALSMNRDICALNLNGIASDKALINLFSTIPDNSLLLIEDIDCIFHERIPVNKDTKITFSCLINCIDGVMSKDGVITVLTTNHIDKLDPALIRDGRMDVRLEIPPATSVEINLFLKLFYGQEAPQLDYGINLNMSSVQEVCMRNQDNPSVAIEKILLESFKVEPEIIK